MHDITKELLKPDNRIIYSLKETQPVLRFCNSGFISVSYNMKTQQHDVLNKPWRKRTEIFELCGATLSYWLPTAVYNTGQIQTVKQSETIEHKKYEYNSLDETNKRDSEH